MKNKNVLRSIIAVTALALVVIIMLFTYLHFKPETQKGSKEVVVEVVIPDEETKEFTLHTDALYLSQALEEENLIKGTKEEFGLFITEVNGRIADVNNKEWWCITKNGEDVFTGADVTPIADGEHFEITLTVGY